MNKARQAAGTNVCRGEFLRRRAQPTAVLFATPRPTVGVHHESLRPVELGNRVGAYAGLARCRQGCACSLLCVPWGCPAFACTERTHVHHPQGSPSTLNARQRLQTCTARHIPPPSLSSCQRICLHCTPQNVNDLATYIIQLAVVVMHLGRLSISSDWLSILAAAQCILLLFRLQYFSR